MFTIRHDPVRRIVSVQRWGLWDEDQAARYRRALAAEIGQAARHPTPFDVLIDIGQAETMPQAATRIMAEVASDLERGAARRIAFAGSGAVKRMQVRRLVGEPSRFATFDTVDLALIWLAEGA